MINMAFQNQWGGKQIILQMELGGLINNLVKETQITY